MDSQYVTVKTKNKFLTFLKKNHLLISILASIVIGFAIGIGLKSSSLSKENVQWFTLPGNLFIRSLELLIVPVVFVGVVAATSSLSAKSNLRITLICVGLCLLTHILATLTGLAGSLILVALSKKQEIEANTADILVKQKTTFDIISDILRNLIPKNIIRATTNQELTKYYPIIVNNETVYEKKVEYIEGSNILGILVFALLIGLSSSIAEKKQSYFVSFLNRAMK